MRSTNRTVFVRTLRYGLIKNQGVPAQICAKIDNMQCMLSKESPKGASKKIQVFK